MIIWTRNGGVCKQLIYARHFICHNLFNVTRAMTDPVSLNFGVLCAFQNYYISHSRKVAIQEGFLLSLAITDSLLWSGVYKTALIELLNMFAVL